MNAIRKGLKLIICLPLYVVGVGGLSLLALAEWIFDERRTK